MIDVNGPRTRRERTFIGSECAACEEPLEHTLRGERILQLSCGHVSHEACFYEYIREFELQNCPTCNAPLGLDTSRGGNLDFGMRTRTFGKSQHTHHLLEKLNTLVRSAQSPDLRNRQSPRPLGQYESPKPSSSQWNSPQPSNHWDSRKQQSGQWDSPKQLSGQWNTPKEQSGQWDTETLRNTPRSLQSQYPEQEYRNGQSSMRDQPRPRERYDKYSGGSDTRSHARNDSGTTGGHSATTDFADQHQMNGRRHDYDVQSMEMSVSSPRMNAKNPIPPPTVTVRSEFPTLSRSRQQQSLTCLITVEVCDGKWQPDPEDIRGPPTAPPSVVPESYAQPKQPQRRPPSDIPRESPEVLQRVTDELHAKVENWHGLDFAR